MMPRTAIFIAMIVISLTGCSDSIVWNKAELETELKRQLELDWIAINKNEDGSFTGNCSTMDGIVYDLSISPDDSEPQLTWSATTEDGKERGGILKYQ